MCNNKTLARSHNGYVFQCEQCGLFQLAFGTSLLAFAPAELEAFHERIKDQLGRPLLGLPNHKCIAVELFTNNSYMLLCPDEMQELGELLHEASFALELRAIIGNLIRHDH